MVKEGRTYKNALAHLKAGNANLDIRRERREVPEDELLRLLDAAEKGSTLFGLTGEQRRRLYLVAVSTGLTPSHFDLNSDPPTVRIDATDEKSRRGGVLPIPSDLVTMLRPWLATIAPDAKLWPGDWAKKRRGSKMMIAYLKQAGIAYRDDDGQQADFHALRHTYLGRLGRSGASPKAMQSVFGGLDIRPPNSRSAATRTPICSTCSPPGTCCRRSQPRHHRKAKWSHSKPLAPTTSDLPSCNLSYRPAYRNGTANLSLWFTSLPHHPTEPSNAKRHRIVRR